MIKIKHKPYSKNEFIEICIKYNTRTEIAAYYNCAPNTITSAIKRHFPEILRYPSKMSLGTRFLAKEGKKRCSKCNAVKSYEEYHVDNHTTDGRVGKCKDCRKEASADYYQNNKEKYYANRAKYRAAKLERTPKWANMLHIEEFYARCPEGHEVDHIVPLQGERVCGLHVLENLQYLTVVENRSKSNKYEEE
jgi:5-methylcytosine-specific restriction endonuclease McrA